MDTSRQIVYAEIFSPSDGLDGGRTCCFVRAWRVPRHLRNTAISRGAFQAAILKSERIVLDCPPPKDADFHGRLKRDWLTLTPAPNNHATHFIECGVVSGIQIRSRQLYVSPRFAHESLFFRGAFVLTPPHGWTRDSVAQFIGRHLLSHIEKDWGTFDSAALAPTYGWLMISIMSSWRSIKL